LHLTPSGEVVQSGGSGISIPPYIVINIADGIIDAPSSEAITKAVAVDILEKYDSRFNYPSDEELAQGASTIFQGLQKIGESYYFMSRIKRFEELKSKANKSTGEIQRMNDLKQEIESTFESIKLAI